MELYPIRSSIGGIRLALKPSENDHVRCLKPWLDQLLRRDTIDRIPALHAGEVRRQWRLIADGKQRYDGRFWRWINLINWSEQFDIQYS